MIYSINLEDRRLVNPDPTDKMVQVKVGNIIVNSCKNCPWASSGYCPIDTKVGCIQFDGHARWTINEFKTSFVQMSPTTARAARQVIQFICDGREEKIQKFLEKLVKTVDK